MPPPTIGGGFPFAMFIAIGILAVVEFIVRQIEPRDLIVYERGTPQRFAIRRHLQAYGSPEVVFVGSSRVHIGIVVPLVSKSVNDNIDHHVDVANFASGGALVQELAPLIECMLRERPLPKVLLYGIDPEQIARSEMHNDRSAVFWTVGDWWAARASFGIAVDADLSTVILGAISDVYQTFRYRDRPFSLLKQLTKGRERSPILGDAQEPEHSADSTRSLVDNPADATAVQHHVETVHLDNGRYPFNELKVKLLTETITHCRAAGIKVVLFEVPNAEVFNRWLPAGVYPRFYAIMKSVATDSGAQFFSLDDLNLSFVDSQFRDPVHLNLAGATLLSKTLAQDVITPLLRAIDSKPPHP